MPIYEYRCRQCGNETEALQKMSEGPLVNCPSCGNATLVKLVSAAGFQLKGTGWYATDFRGSGQAKPGANGAKAGEAGADSKSNGAKAAEAGSGSKSSASEGGSSGDAPACGAGACPACQ